jgi:Cu(I)/Ag(I) efflux system membrane fusion protein
VNKLLTGLVLIILGTATGYLAQRHISDIIDSTGLFESTTEGSDQSSGEKEILYWVAPMDANYRREEPGKSPMGMDLVPVYAGDGSTEDGVVKISPTVENNLGVRVSPVQSGILNRTIDTVGYVSFDEEKIFHVHTRVEGWVERLHVRSVGQTVKKGQKLFELYSPDLVNAQEELITALKSKNNILINASKSRLRFLGTGNTQIKLLEKSRKVRQRIDVYSQHDGFINELNVREGMFIKPATDILSIGQIDTVWVIAEVFEQQSGWIKIGQKVDMKVGALPGVPWQGTVDYIYPVLDAKTRTLRVRVRFDNPKEQLKPNMYAQLTIHAQTDRETLFVPREAVIRSGRMDRVVKALGEGKYLSVAVKTGIESDNAIEILDGLQANEKIVTSAQFLIDSESSLTASFERMQDPASNEMTMDMQSDENPNQVWIDGEIKKVMPGHNMLTIQHKPVDAWGWPTMVMDFTVQENISINHLEANSSIRFLVEKLGSGSIKIIEIDGDNTRQTMDDSQAWVKGNINSIDKEQYKLNLSHEPVEVWGWPSMMMDFSVSKSIDIGQLQKGQSMQFLVKKQDSGAIEIVDMKQEQ